MKTSNIVARIIRAEENSDNINLVGELELLDDTNNELYKNSDKKIIFKNELGVVACANSIVEENFSNSKVPFSCAIKSDFLSKLRNGTFSVTIEFSNNSTKEYLNVNCNFFYEFCLGEKIIQFSDITNNFILRIMDSISQYSPEFFYLDKANFELESNSKSYDYQLSYCGVIYKEGIYLDSEEDVNAYLVLRDNGGKSYVVGKEKIEFKTEKFLSRWNAFVQQPCISFSFIKSMFKFKENESYDVFITISTSYGFSFSYKLDVLQTNYLGQRSEHDLCRDMKFQDFIKMVPQLTEAQMIQYLRFFMMNKLNYTYLLSNNLNGNHLFSKCISILREIPNVDVANCFLNSCDSIELDIS